jgi:hypothetical protein
VRPPEEDTDGDALEESVHEGAGKLGLKIPAQVEPNQATPEFTSKGLVHAKLRYATPKALHPHNVEMTEKSYT